MIYLLSALAVALTTTGGSAGSVDWQADYGKALAATRVSGQPLLVVLDVPSDPKAALQEKHLYGTGEVEAYQCCHVDVSTEYGKQVADAFGATKFPFTAIIDKTGSVVLSKTTGNVSDTEWRATLKKYQAGDRASSTINTSFFRGDGTIPSSVQSPSYCPSCQMR
jgi:hypothetical protein